MLSPLRKWQDAYTVFFDYRFYLWLGTFVFVNTVIFTQSVSIDAARPVLAVLSIIYMSDIF